MSELILNQLVERCPILFNTIDKIRDCAQVIIKCYSAGGKVLVCGNGGSSADSDHISGELMKSFENRRNIDNNTSFKFKQISSKRGHYIASKLEPGLSAISLSANSSLISAIANDMGADLVYAQQVYVYGNKGDVLIGISTSGNSQNIIDAIITAKAKDMVVVGLTGEDGGEVKNYCDILINVPGKRTALIQELHLPVYHTICMIIENHFFPKNC